MSNRKKIFISILYYNDSKNKPNRIHKASINEYKKQLFKHINYKIIISLKNFIKNKNKLKLTLLE